MIRRQKNSQPANSVPCGNAVSDKLPQRLFDFDFQKARGARNVVQERSAAAFKIARHFHGHRGQRVDLIEPPAGGFKKRIELLPQQKGQRRIARRRQ
jgi:hypothetical protein